MAAVARSSERAGPAVRSRAQVDATLQTAKLNPAELLPAVQCLSFGPQAGGGECCLLQLEPGLCAELEAGRRYGPAGGPGKAGLATLVFIWCGLRSCPLSTLNLLETKNYLHL